MTGDSRRTIESLPTGPARESVHGVLYGVGLNYRDHAEQQGYDLPEEPFVFLKNPRSVVGDGDGILLPADEPGRFEVETELAVRVGRRLREADVCTARASIDAYAVANDLSDRTLQRAGQVSLGKGREGFCPLSRWVPIADGAPVESPRTIRTWIGGELVQEGSTAEMIHSPAEILSFISGYVTLEPGDVVLTGTPGGSPLGLRRGLSVRPRDTVTCEIEGVGRMSNPVLLRESGGMR